MTLYLIKATWRYDDTEHIVGITDFDHIDEVKEAYEAIYKPLADNIRYFEVEEFDLNKAYA